MSNIAVLLILCVLVVAHSQVYAQLSLSPMTASQIRAEMFGQMFTGEYKSGARWAERFNPNMTSIYVEDGKPIHGHMQFEGFTLCFEYPYRSDLQGGCFEVWKRSDNCFDFYGTQDIASLDQRRWGRGWTARAWISDQPSTCKSDLIS